MAHQDNDEVARALAALAGGAVPSEHETPSNGIPSESTVFDTEPAKPAAAKPLFAPNAVPATINRAPTTPATTPAQKPAPPAPPAPPGAAKVARTRAPSPSPAAPAAVLPPVPTVPPVAKVRQSPTSKRPAMPTRPVTPVPAAPALPLPVEPAAADVESDDILSEITEDDEMIAPAPDLAAFTPRARPVVVKAHLYEQTNFRRTIIPILLTGGLLLIALGAWSRLDHDGLLGGVGVGVGVLFITLGVLLIAVGVLNMLQVRHILNSANAGR